jgi:hypothetical protein
MKFIVIFAVIFLITCIVGIVMHIKSRKKLNKPSLGLIISIIFQLLLFLSFFGDVLVKFPKIIADLLWGGAIFSGLIFGVKEFKNNIILSVFSILLSISLAGLMLLMLAITSM